MKKTDFLDTIDIASPCQAAWRAMTGTDRVRHCDDCQLNVYNLSEMTREEATRLVEQTEGSMCVRLHRRDDGTVLTRDCPTGLAALRRRARLAYARVAALVSVLFAGMLGCTRRDYTDPLMGEPTFMGEVCLPQQALPQQALPQQVLPQKVLPQKLLGRVCPPEPQTPPQPDQTDPKNGEIQRPPARR